MDAKVLRIEIPEGYEIDEKKSTFEEIIFKRIKKKLPTCYGELPSLDVSYYLTSDSQIRKCKFHAFSNNANNVRTEEQAKSIQVLPKLLQLRDEYRQGWVPDWKNCDPKYCIYFNDEYNRVKISAARYGRIIFSFQTEGLAEGFLRHFRKELEIYFKGLV